MKNLMLLAAFGILVTGCSSPRDTKTISAEGYSCSDVGKKIGRLEQEKRENNSRVEAGVETFFPASAVIHLVQGTESTKYSITTGEWGEAVDSKLMEMESYQRQCR